MGECYFMRIIRFNNFLMVGLLMVLFLSIGMAFAAEDTALNDGNTVFQDSIDDADSTLLVNEDIQNIDEKLDEIDVDSVQSEDSDNAIKGTVFNDYIPKAIIVSGDTFDDVQNAIDSANDGDEIIVYSANGNGSQIIVNKSVTIRGVGNTSTLDARNLSRIFCILRDNVVIKNLRLINGCQNISQFQLIDFDFNPNCLNQNMPQTSDDPNLKGCGGAIKWLGNNGSLINCTLTDNCLIANVIESGNTISWLGENGRIINSLFDLNWAQATIPIYGNTYKSNVIDNSVYGVYYGDLDGRVFFADVAVNYDLVLDLKNVSTYYKSGDKVSFSFKAGHLNCVNETFSVAIYREAYGKEFNVTTDSNGLLSFKIPTDMAVGKYKLKVWHSGEDYNISGVSYITVNKVPAKVSLSKYNTYYNSGKKFTFKVFSSKNNVPLPLQEIVLNVFTGKSNMLYHAKTDKNGKATINLSKISAGKHKVEISNGGSDLILSKTTTICISKAKTAVKLNKSAFKYKRADKLKVTVTDRRTKKPVKNTKVTVKVFTGKKYKTYNLKTNQKGIIQINTKNLKKGTHKIKINSNNKFYTISKNTSIKVK